jgi:GntR family transcriptional regulator, transcriptional repressor for pyruvate dehydrogenase complex
MMAPNPSPLRPARLAEMVAGVLRQRILDGELPDGAELPKQEDLLAEFGISQPPLREALRILESERLITVRRGNQGGAVVHRPSETAAASLVAMLLQSRDVTLGQLLDAMAAIEPLCVAAAARRTDRATTVLPVLRATIDASIAALDDADKYTGLARQFHHDVVATCGNAALEVVCGVLEALWTVHVDRLARDTGELGEYAEVAARKTSVREHERIFNAIAKGDATAAERAAHTHTGGANRDGWKLDLTQRVDSALLFASRR